MTHTKVIDSRCEDMLLKGLLTETTNLRLSGQLPDASQPARAIGYRQTLTYLESGSMDTCTKTYTTTDTDTPETDKINEMKTNESNGVFDAYVDDFKAVTRRYAKKQMSWFRKDDNFLFIPVSLKYDDDDQEACPSADIEEASNMIQYMCTLNRDAYDKELKSSGSSGSTLMLPKDSPQKKKKKNDKENSNDKRNSSCDSINHDKNDDDNNKELYESISAQTKRLNEEQGKKMKFYVPRRHKLIKGSDEYKKLLEEAGECIKRIQGNNN